MTRAGIHLGLAFALLAIAGVARAGGPLVFSTNGQPVGWNNSAPVRYQTDRGTLGYLANDDAVAEVSSLFATWSAVPTAVIAFERSGATSVDVDASNFGPFLGPYGGASAPLGASVIVFDADGAIFDTLYGLGTGVLGFAGPTFLSDGVDTVPIGDPVPPGARIVEGLAFLNGKWIDGIDDPVHGNRELSLNDFEGVFVHEFGHFAGLDHTQIHGLALPPEVNAAGVTRPIETMYPFFFDATQKTPERDDAVALSVLYPSASFSSTTGRITGRVLASSGTPLSGINVIARNVDDDADAVSYVSGATLVPLGRFTLHGLTPGAHYRVDVQEVDAFNAGGSSVGPFSPPLAMPGPPEAYSGASESADPAIDDPSTATAIAATAGATVAGIDVVLNYQDFAVGNLPIPDGGHFLTPAFGDFDGDAIVDAVVPQFDATNHSLTRFHHGLGDGRFAPPVTIDTLNGVRFAAAGQFNAGVDAFLDVAVLSTNRLEIRVYSGNGSGGFGPPATLLNLPDDSSKGLLGLAAADLNADGWTDLLTVVVDGASEGATSYAFLGSAAGAFTLVSTVFPPGSGFPRGELRIAQLAGSPALDAIGRLSDVALGLLIGDGAGGFTPSAVSMSGVSERLGYGLDVGDFDEDGSADVVVADMHPAGGPIAWTESFIDVLRGDGSGLFTLATRYAVPEPFQDTVVATEIDGDGHLDVASIGAWFGPGHPGAMTTIALGNGAGGVGAPRVIWGLAEYPTFLAAADLDGDGRTDLFAGGEFDVLGPTPDPLYSVLLQNRCGNGVVESAEECDDGNRTHGDGCDGNCRVTACGNGVVSSGEACDDGNTESGDGCSASCLGEPGCGDGVVAGAEECDDGNVLDGDCCSSSCAIEPPGTPCLTATTFCTVGSCMGSAVCQEVPRPPRPDCRPPAIAHAGKLVLRNRSDDHKDRFDWKWAKGTATPKSAFGDPTIATDYGLCLYDAAGALLATASVPGGALCNPAHPTACWKQTGSGFRYADVDASAAGVRRIVLKEGLADGKAAITIAGKGANLELPVLPIAPAALPVRLQLGASNGECWEATFGSAVGRNTSETFSATND